MNDLSHAARQTASDPMPARRPWPIAVMMLTLVAAFYLLREHWGHLAGAWPYLLLACPLLHLMHGHGGHGGHAHHAPHDATPGGGATSPERR